MYDQIKPKLSALAIGAFGAETASAFPQYILASNNVSELLNIFKNKRAVLDQMLDQLSIQEQVWIHTNIFRSWLKEGNR